MVFEPKRAVPQSTWRTGDLVIVKDRGGSELLGVIVDATKQHDMYEGPLWTYRVLISGSISMVFESKSGSSRISRRVNEPYDIRLSGSVLHQN